MLKIFIEFKVKGEAREAFLALIPELKLKAQEQGAEQFGIYEGTDQPLLFVEEFYVKDHDHYQRIKQERLDGQSPFWNKMHDCIEGGAKKLHIWAFKPLL
jgi:L-rhamnose mutarotase